MLRSLRTFVLLVLAAATVSAFDFSVLKPQGHVSDFSGSLDPHTKAVLERYCEGVKEATGAEIALVTIDTLHGEPIEDVADLLYRKWGIGPGETDEGLLLLLAIGDRQSRLEVGYGLEPYIPDGYAGSLLREMRPELRAGDYGRALSIAVQALGSRIAAAKGVAIEAGAPRVRPSAQRREPGWPVGGLALLILLAAGMMLSGAARRRLGGPFGFSTAGYPGRFRIYPLVLPGGSSGAFGGYDSSDSFGGFGGGDSGGGGASSKW